MIRVGYASEVRGVDADETRTDGLLTWERHTEIPFQNQPFLSFEVIAGVVFIYCVLTMVVGGASYIGTGMQLNLCLPCRITYDGQTIRPFG